MEGNIEDPDNPDPSDPPTTESDENPFNTERLSISETVLMDTDVYDELHHSHRLSVRKSSISIFGHASADIEKLATDRPKRRSRLASVEEAQRKIDDSWHQENHHVFIMSRSGKPIYTLHGDENSLVNKFSVLSVLIDFVARSTESEAQDNDTIESIALDGIKFVFLLKYPLVFVGATRHQFNERQVKVQLNDVYNLILSIVTLRRLDHVFLKENYDLRELLSGQEHQITTLLNSHTGCKVASNTPFMHLTNSIRVLKLTPSERDAVSSAIRQGCSKIDKIVFAVLIANSKIVTIVSLATFKLHQADLRLLINIVDSCDRYQTAEVWKPICLPHFNSEAHLNAYISCLQPDSKATLVLLRVDYSIEAFNELSVAKEQIVETMKKNRSMQAIEKSVCRGDPDLRDSNIPYMTMPEFRHFIYKWKKLSQIFCSEVNEPYINLQNFERLVDLYYSVHNRVHNVSGQVDLITDSNGMESIMVMISERAEIYAVFEPTIRKEQMPILVKRLQSYIEKEKDSLFIVKTQNF